MKKQKYLFSEILTNYSHNELSIHKGVAKDQLNEKYEILVAVKRL